SVVGMPPRARISRVRRVAVARSSAATSCCASSVQRPCGSGSTPWRGASAHWAEGVAEEGPVGPGSVEPVQPVSSSSASAATKGFGSFIVGPRCPQAIRERWPATDSGVGWNGDRLHGKIARPRSRGLPGGLRMSSSVRVALSLSLLFLLLAPFAHVSDASVATRLEPRGIHYEIDEDGAYTLTYSYADEQRTQLVFVSGGTESVGEFHVREVFAPAARLEADGITGEVALQLLADSRTSKLGAWEVAGDILYFVIKLPDDIGAARLETAMDIAAQVADDAEKRFSGDRDELWPAPGRDPKRGAGPACLARAAGPRCTRWPTAPPSRQLSSPARSRPARRCSAPCRPCSR